MKENTVQGMLSIITKELRENGKWGTAHIYQTTQNMFSVFNESQELPFDKLTPAILKHFEIHLRQRDCSWNTVSTYMKQLRSAYNRAVDLGYTPYVHRLFSNVYTGTRADKKRTLEASDVGAMVQETEYSLAQKNEMSEEQYSLSLSTLQKTQMLFVLMFMMRGIPFVDLAYLRKKDLRGNVLFYRRRKTGRSLRVLLSNEAMQLVLLLCNRGNDSPYLFPILHSKEGSEEAYHEYQSALRCFNKHLFALQEKLGLGSPLSTYTARHTWATMAYYCEIHPGIISEAMGHSSIGVTETYLKPFQDKKIDEANQMVISFVKSDRRMK